MSKRDQPPRGTTCPDCGAGFYDAHLRRGGVHYAMCGRGWYPVRVTWGAKL